MFYTQKFTNPPASKTSRQSNVYIRQNVGAFQVNIPVTNKSVMLRPEGEYRRCLHLAVARDVTDQPLVSCSPTLHWSRVRARCWSGGRPQLDSTYPWRRQISYWRRGSWRHWRPWRPWRPRRQPRHIHRKGSRRNL